MVHLQEAGFEVDARDVSDVALRQIKSEQGIAPEHQGCHTALVQGFVFEGHVPADLIAQILTERPEIRGLAVPGMPVGSPGMGGNPAENPFDVLALENDGAASVYSHR